MYHRAGNIENSVKNIFRSDLIEEGIIQSLYLLLSVSEVISAFMTKFERMVQ